jgi:hypothetical protein
MTPVSWPRSLMCVRRRRKKNKNEEEEWEWEQFKVILKRHLITRSFYSVDEYVMFTNNSYCL